MPSGYQCDLAYIHDVGFGFYAGGAAPGLLGILRDAGVAGGLVVDLGCGSGLWARDLLDAGYAVRGIDRSADMLRLARARCPEATFQRASFVDVRLPPCDAVTAIGEIFNFLFDPTNRHDTLVRLFGRVHEALRPGGLLVFDVAEPGRGGGLGVRHKHFHGDDWTVLVEQEEKDGILTRRLTTFRRVGRLYRRGEEVHRLRLCRGAELAVELRRLGFRTRVAHSYGNFPLLPGMVAVIARKP